MDSRQTISLASEVNKLRTGLCMTRANPGTDRFVDVDRHIKILEFTFTDVYSRCWSADTEGANNIISSAYMRMLKHIPLK